MSRPAPPPPGIPAPGDELDGRPFPPIILTGVLPYGVALPKPNKGWACVVVELDEQTAPFIDLMNENFTRVTGQPVHHTLDSQHPFHSNIDGGGGSDGVADQVARKKKLDRQIAIRFSQPSLRPGTVPLPYVEVFDSAYACVFSNTRPAVAAGSGAIASASATSKPQPLLSPDNDVEQLDEAYMCMVCHGTYLLAPHRHIVCDKIFCLPCLTSMRQSKQQHAIRCPNCRGEDAEFNECSEEFRVLANDLLVICSSCHETMSFQHFKETHLHQPAQCAAAAALVASAAAAAQIKEEEEAKEEAPLPLSPLPLPRIPSWTPEEFVAFFPAGTRVKFKLHLQGILVRENFGAFPLIIARIMQVRPLPL